MLRHKNNYIGDTWYYVKGDSVHCYYLTCPNTIERHTAWDIGHAVSKDLINWSHHHIVVEKGKPGEWDDICLATGSILKHNDRYYMAYTAKWNKPDVAAGLAVSDDLYIWEKTGAPITQIDEKFYERVGSGARKISHWRDPFLFKHDGYVYHGICASKNNGPLDARGTVGLARTKDMESWEVVAPPIIEEVAAELECPQIRPFGNGYILLFSSFAELFSKALQEEMGEENLPNTCYAMYSDNIFGPYIFKGRTPIMPADFPGKPYALQLIEFKGNQYLMGTVWDFEDGNDYVTDPIPVENRDGRLRVCE